MEKHRRRLKKQVKALIVVSVLLLVAIAALVCTFMPFMVKLNGPATYEVAFDSEYEELGAVDIFNHPISRIEGAVDTSAMGSYTITYRFLNAKKERVVIVKDMTAPELVLLGSSSLTISQYGKYKEPGYVAIDNLDGNITDNVQVTTDLDVNVLGNYTITYEVTDSSGNKVRARRTISVVDAKPLEMSLKEFSLDGYFEGTILKKTSANTKDKLKNLTIVGDSVIDNLYLWGYLKNTGLTIWTRSSLDPENIYERALHKRSSSGTTTFFEELEKTKPEYLCILMGTNDSYSMTVEYFAQIYEEFVIKVVETSPNTKLIICSLLPVNGTGSDEKRNDRINKMNYYLASIAEKYNMYFMNCAEAFKDSNGYAKKEYITSDGIHPNKEVGSNVLFEYIKSHLSY